MLIKKWLFTPSQLVILGAQVRIYRFNQFAAIEWFFEDADQIDRFADLYGLSVLFRADADEWCSFFGKSSFHGFKIRMFLNFRICNDKIWFFQLERFSCLFNGIEFLYPVFAFFQCRLKIQSYDGVLVNNENQFSSRLIRHC